MTSFHSWCDVSFKITSVECLLVSDVNIMIFLSFQDHNVAFMETSAKTGLNVDLAFMAVAR